MNRRAEKLRDVFEEEIDRAVDEAVDVGDADAVAILFSAAQVVNPRLVFTKIGPQDT